MVDWDELVSAKMLQIQENRYRDKKLLRRVRENVDSCSAVRDGERINDHEGSFVKRLHRSKADVDGVFAFEVSTREGAIIVRDAYAMTYVFEHDYTDDRSKGAVEQAIHQCALLMARTIDRIKQS